MINPADTAFVLFSSALVMLMTPGLALFYGGLVRAKNVLATIMQNYILLGLIMIQWILIGYSLAFGPDIKGLIGSLAWAGLDGVGLEPFKAYSETIPHQAFMVFQAMFAIITPALMTGTWAERMKFSSFLVFSLLWATLVYDPIAHWVWGDGGWLKNLGVLDFAGGIVVHVSAGVSALAAALVVGRRRGYGSEAFIPHNLPMTILGAGLLWFGWFGFNAGSALASGSLSTTAFVNTQISAAMATLSWVGAEWLRGGKPTSLGAVSGSIAGLAAVTPAAGYVGPMAALVIGLVAGVICYVAVVAKVKMGYDDALDVVGVHGVSGTWGTLATGLFATTAINAGAANGLFYGNPKQLGIQAVAVVVTAVFSFGATWILLKLVDLTMGLRVVSDKEVCGLDIAEHQEAGYTT
jgi:ammonium transporter, Amt family